MTVYNCSMAYNRNYIENDRFQAVQLNIGHDSRTYVRNVHANDRPLAKKLMASVWHHRLYAQIEAVAKSFQLKNQQICQ